MFLAYGVFLRRKRRLSSHAFTKPDAERVDLDIDRAVSSSITMLEPSSAEAVIPEDTMTKLSIETIPSTTSKSYDPSTLSLLSDADTRILEIQTRLDQMQTRLDAVSSSDSISREILSQTTSILEEDVKTLSSQMQHLAQLQSTSSAALQNQIAQLQAQLQSMSIQADFDPPPRY